MYARLTGCHFLAVDLESALDRSLADSTEFAEGSEDAIVDEAIRRGCAATVGPQTLFPGLPCDPELTRQTFHEVVRRIEQ